jgi:hypothetical protein
VRKNSPLQIALEAAPFGEALVFRWSAASNGEHRSACSLDSLPLLLDEMK